MHGMNVRVQVQAGKVEEAAKLLREQVMPTAANYQGFMQNFLIVDAPSNRLDGPAHSRGQIGTVEHCTMSPIKALHMRAKTLLAEVHALLGYGASAVKYANDVKSYFPARSTEDWELACVHVIHAHAAAGR